MTGTLAAQQFIGLDANGAPLVGGLVYTYFAGTTTAATTYSDAGLTTPNANPVVLDAAGVANIFLDGSTYKFVTKTSAGATVRTLDNITSIPATANTGDFTGTAGENLTAGQIAYVSVVNDATCGKWYKADADATASSTAAQGLGVVIADAVTGASVTIRGSGVYAAASGLTPGSAYYISATAGALTATPPANARLFCRALSATSYLISFRQEEGTVTGSGTLVRATSPTLVTPTCDYLSTTDPNAIRMLRGQTVIIQPAAATVGQSFAIIPDLAGTAQDFVMTAATQTLAGKTISVNVGTGGSTASVFGKIYYNATSSASTSTGGEDVLRTTNVAANTLNANGMTMRVRAWGEFADTACTARILFGGTQYTSVTSAASQNHWYIEASIIRTGSATQAGGGFGNASELLTPSNHTATANSTTSAVDTTAIIAVTVSAYSVSSGSVTFKGMTIEVI